MIGLGLWIIGVPSAPLWGMLAMIMRFVPYIGALISAIFPLILAAAVGPGWTMFLITAALFIVAETIVGQAIEPLVYGQSTGLSPVAVIVSATFWTWLWGPVGLILATPLSMCLVVVGRHVDRLEFLEVMFGDQPPLTPAELIYQRMLANDPIEAVEHPVLCIPGVGLLDEAVAILIAQLVERRGIGARSEQPEALSLSRILSLDTKNVALICLCYTGTATNAQIGYAIRRVRRKAPGAFIVVSLFGNAVSIEGLEQHGELDLVTQSLRATIERIVAAAIRVETENDLPGLGLPPSVAAIEKSPRKDAATAI